MRNRTYLAVLSVAFALFLVFVGVGYYAASVLAEPMPNLDDMLWEAPHNTISQETYSLNSQNPYFTIHYPEPLDQSRQNIGFQIQTMNLPSYITVHIILTDNNNNNRLYTLYNRATSLLGSGEYTNQIISWVSYYTPMSSPDFNPLQVEKLTVRVLSNGDQWVINIRDIRAYDEIQLYPEGAVIICADGAPYQGVSDLLLPSLDRYGYKMCLATATTTNPNWGIIEQMAAEGHDIGVYGRMFDLVDKTLLLPLDDFEFNTYGQKAIIESHTGNPVCFLQANRHITDERTDQLLAGFPLVKGSGFTYTSHVALPFFDYYGGSCSVENDLSGISQASETGTIYILFDHFYPEWHYAAKSQLEIDQIVDHIHATGVRVVTWSQLYEDLQLYLNTSQTPKIDLFTVELNGEGYYIIEDGVKSQSFGTKEEIIDYLINRVEEW